MDAMRVKAQSIGGDSTLKPTRRLPRRVGSAEIAYGGVELLGLLEVADVPAAGDHASLVSGIACSTGARR
jgi:hypothetical protein